MSESDPGRRSTRNGTRPLARIVTARFVSLVGTGMAPIGLAFACIQTPRVGVAGLGYCVAAEVIGQTCFLVFGGIIADRFSARRSMIAGDVASAMTQASIAILFASGIATIPSIVGVAFLGGAALALSSPSLNTMLRDSVEQSRFAHANAAVRTSGTIARIIVAPLGGLLIAVGSPSVLLEIDAATFAISALILVGIPSSTRRRPSTVLADLMAGWRAFRAERWIVVVSVGSAFVNMARVGAFTVLGPYVMHFRRHGAEQWGWLGAAQMIGSVLCLWTVARMQPRRVLLASVWALAFSALFMFGLALNVGLLGLLVLAVGSGAGISFYGIKTDTVLQECVPIETLSRVTAFGAVLGVALSPLGAVLSGLAAPHFGSTSTIVVWGLVVTVTIVAMALQRSIRTFAPAVVPASTAP